MVLPSIISVIPPTVLAALAIYIFFKGWRDKGIRIFMILLIILIFYGILEVIIQNRLKINNVACLLRIKSAFWGLVTPLSCHTVIALMKDKRKRWRYVLIYLYMFGLTLIVLLLSGFTVYKEYYLEWWGWGGIMNTSNWFFWAFHIYLVTGVTAFIIILFAIRRRTGNYRIQKLAQAMLINFLWGGSFVVVPYTIMSWFKLPSEIFLTYAGNVAMFLITFAIEKYQPEKFSVDRLLPGLVSLLPAGALLLTTEKKILIPAQTKILFDGITSDEVKGKGYEKIFVNLSLIDGKIDKIKADADYTSSFETECYTQNETPISLSITMSGIKNEFNEVIAYLILFNQKSDNLNLLKCLEVSYKLTNREKDVANMLFNGYSNMQICDRLFISLNTVKTHTRNIYQKTNTATRAEFRNFCKKLVG